MNDLLLVIDMQNVYLPDQPWACETVAHTKANILKLLEKHPKNQTIFTRYIAAEHPVGTWKTYNELNRKINEDPWMNELMDGIKEAAETYLIYDKSTYSSFQVPAIRQAAREADRIILTGERTEDFSLTALQSCLEDRFFQLELLIFRTGNGDHFRRVACLHFSVFHANIIPQNAAKSQCFQWFPPVLFV